VSHISSYRTHFHIAVLSAVLSLSVSASGHLTVAELKSIKLPEVMLDSVEHVEGKDKSSGFVKAHGTIGSHIRFELLLPDDWNGRFAMGGGGGFVGTVQNGVRYSVAKGYATAGTDTGHQTASGITAKWAFNDLEAKLNFGYMAVHRTAEVSKALIRAYYGKDASRSYFLGCSRGGGQAMMEAQRFPNDFDGIVAGAPAFNWTGLAAMAVQIAKTLYPDPANLDSTAITKETLENLARSVMEQCDARDGLKDGVIQNPPMAGFDLSKVEGLTADQRKGIEAIYAGGRTAGKNIYPGFSPAAECDPNQWIAWITGPAPQLAQRERAPDLMFAFGTQIFKYLIFNDPDWDYSKYDFSNFERDSRLAASYLNATNPDLQPFKTREGKLIIWHGWADPALPAEASVDYYREVLAKDNSARDYCRLFMVPGCLHCGGGPGASEVDWLSVIVDWVEQGKAPEQLIATKKENGKTIMTRPLYPYPSYAKYKGSGDKNDAASFEAKTSAGN
jgi:feruloyl esterase